MPTVPFGSKLVRLNDGGVITIVSLALTFCAGLPASVTLTVTGELPAVVGVPLTVHPVSDKPAGRVPALIEHVYGVVPPVAVMVEL